MIGGDYDFSVINILGSQLLCEPGFSEPKAHLAAMCSRKHTHLGNRETREGNMRIAQVAPLIESVPPKQYGGTERIVSYLT